MGKTPICEVWDLKVVPRGAIIRLSGRVYRGRGHAKLMLVQDAFLLFSLLKP